MSRPRILIVEDEAIVALALLMKLKAWGYDTVGPAVTGRDAITTHDREKPDLALLDIFLADSVDGIEVARHIKDLSATPFIFLTASQDADTQKRALSLSPAAVVSKPYDDAALGLAIREALASRGAST